ncbi:MAG: response regulator, partial [Bacteroidetes bacterium]|nr:response regulator [Bacteroidota bacterium]
MNKILIIDDNKINLLALKSIVNINFPNFNVITCSSGIEGLKIAKEINPKVILLDIVMPDMDGYEVCMKLKSDTILANIPVILITAYKTDVDSRIKGFNAGADAFLTKPIEPTELRAQLHSMIRIRE